MKRYLILSLDHSPADGAALWWGPRNSGFTKDIDKAGLYDEENVQMHKSYYDNGLKTKAALNTEVYKLSTRSVDWNKVNNL